MGKHAIIKETLLLFISSMRTDLIAYAIFSWPGHHPILLQSGEGEK
jgi:hypothetical protein